MTHLATPDFAAELARPMPPTLRLLNYLGIAAAIAAAHLVIDAWVDGSWLLSALAVGAVAWLGLTAFGPDGLDDVPEGILPKTLDLAMELASAPPGVSLARKVAPPLATAERAESVSEALDRVMATLPPGKRYMRYM